VGYGRGAGGLGGRAEVVRIEAQFAVGEYEILVLSADESNGLEVWLREHGYHIPVGAAEALAPYVAQQMKFFVAKVDIEKVTRDDSGTVVLSPLRVTYESPEVRLPVRLGLLNANGKQDLIVYLLSPDSRYEVANYPNVFIPTNLEVIDGVRKHFAAFYAELFDAVMQKKQGRAVVTEYAWQTSSCDPCPGPPLQPNDLASLGNDDPRNGGQARYGYSPWVLTRLHTRYDKTALSDDLVFRVAKPAAGGRSRWDGVSLDEGAIVGDEQANNFQGRYIIRHRWKHAVKCEHPQYGVWGGDPDAAPSDDASSQIGLIGGGGMGAVFGTSPPVAARGLARAPRGRVSLRASVRSRVPLLGMPAKKGVTPVAKPDEQ
jgi:hypothetical protein